MDSGLRRDLVAETETADRAFFPPHRRQRLTSLYVLDILATALILILARHCPEVSTSESAADDRRFCCENVSRKLRWLLPIRRCFLAVSPLFSAVIRRRFSAEKRARTNVWANGGRNSAANSGAEAHSAPELLRRRRGRVAHRAAD